MQIQRETLTRTSFLLLIALSLFWGLNWPIMKVALTSFEPLTFRTFCIGSGAIGLSIIAKCAGLSLWVPRREWKWLILGSVFNILGWNVLVIYGLDLMAAGRSVILAYTMPLWGILLSAVFLREKITPRKYCALILGLIGLAILMGSDILILQAGPTGALLVLGAAVSWATGTVIIKFAKLTIPITVMTAWQLIFAAIPIAILTILFEGTDLPALKLWPTLAVIYNIVLAFNFSYWAWFRIVNEVPVSVSAISILAIPIIGVCASSLFLHEQIGIQELSALTLVVSALSMALIPKQFISKQ